MDMKKINILLFCVFFDDPAVIIAVNIGLVEKHHSGERTVFDNGNSFCHIRRGVFTHGAFHADTGEKHG